MQPAAGTPGRARGVISHYATLALAEATTAGDWLTRSEALMQADVQAGKVPPFYRPELQVLGADNQPAPGRSS
ncbi:MAG: hypothetical protein WBR35_01770 [Anaerolineae bacterium]